jgi:hypothetical protein
VQLDELFALLSAVKAGEVSEAEAIERRFPRSEMLQQSGMRLHGFCPENRMTCDGKVDRFILPCGWLSKGL